MHFTGVLISPQDFQYSKGEFFGLERIYFTGVQIDFFRRIFNFQTENASTVTHFWGVLIDFFHRIYFFQTAFHHDTARLERRNLSPKYTT